MGSCIAMGFLIFFKEDFYGCLKTLRCSSDVDWVGQMECKLNALGNQFDVSE